MSKLSGLERELIERSAMPGYQTDTRELFRRSADALAECRRALEIAGPIVRDRAYHNPGLACDCASCEAIRIFGHALAKLEGGDRGG